MTNRAEDWKGFHIRSTSDKRKAVAVPRELFCGNCDELIGYQARYGPAGELLYCFAPGEFKFRLEKGHEARFAAVKNIRLFDLCGRDATQYYVHKESPILGSGGVKVIRPSIAHISDDFDWRWLCTTRPRPYQIESFMSIIGNSPYSNAITYLPTGAGKTLVASMTAGFMRRLNPQKLVIFVVDRVPLVYQQGKYLEAQTGLSALMLSGQDLIGNNPGLRKRILRFDLLVCTVSVLLNWLGRGIVALDDVCCIIMDEIHHAVKSHPYVTLLEAHYHPFVQRNGLAVSPLLLGLTASPASGAPIQMHRQLQDLCSLCFGQFFMPCWYKSDLDVAVNRPDLEFVTVETTDDEQRVLMLIRPYWRNLVHFVSDQLGFGRAEIDSFTDQMNIIDSRAELRSLARSAAEAKNEFLIRLTLHLQHLLTALEMANLLGAKYAALYLQELLGQFDAPEPVVSMRTELMDHLVGLEGTSFKAEALHALLHEMDSHGDSQDFRVLVFVQTKRTARWLCEWLRQRDSALANRWNPSPFVGQSGVAGVEGMSWSHEQRPLLALFKSGHIKLLIATSVLQEGLDVTACNQVILFDRAWSLTGFVQSRGRARASASKYTVIAPDSEKIYYQALLREELNVKQIILERIKSQTFNNHLYQLPAMLKMLLLNRQAKHVVFDTAIDSDEDLSFDKVPLEAPIDESLMDTGLVEIRIPVYRCQDHETDMSIKFRESLPAKNTLFGIDSVMVVCTVELDRSCFRSWSRLDSSVLHKFSDAFLDIETLVSQLRHNAQLSASAQLQLKDIAIGRLMPLASSFATVQSVSDLQPKTLQLILNPVSRTLALQIGFVENGYRIEIPFAAIDRALFIQTTEANIVVHVPLKQPPYLAQASIGPDFDFRTMLEDCDQVDWKRSVASSFGPFSEIFLDCSALRLSLTLNDTSMSQFVAKLVHCGEKHNLFRVLYGAIPDVPSPKVNWNAKIDELLLNAPIQSAYPIRVFWSLCRKLLIERIETDELVELLMQLEVEFSGQWIDALVATLKAQPLASPRSTIELVRSKISPSASKISSKELFYVNRAKWSPGLGLVFLPKQLIAGNRLLREFGGRALIRLQICDDDGHKLGQSIDINPDCRRKLAVIFDNVKLLLKEGFEMGVKRFKLLAASASQLRSHSCWFAEEESVDRIRSWLGKFDSIKNVAKYVARVGQGLSASMATISVPSHQCRFIDDYLHVDPASGKEHCFSDGCGRIGIHLAKRVADSLGLSEIPTAFQVRYGGCKGVFVTSYLTSDDPECLYIRPSMRKFESQHTVLEVVNYSLGIPCHLNRQIIMILSALGVSDSVFEALLNDHLLRVTGRLLQTSSLTPTSRNFLNYPAGLASYADPFFRQIRQSQYAQQLHELIHRHRIYVPKGKILMGIVDETGQLESDQVFIQIQEDDGAAATVIEGLVVVAKNPCMHAGDVRVLKAVRIGALEPAVKSCIVFPRTGNRPIPDMCSGSDLDGDLYFVSWDSRLLPPRVEEPAKYLTTSSATELDRAISHEDVCDFFINYISNDQLGAIANAHVAFADQLPGGVREELCSQLAVLFGRAVDFPKTGFLPSLPASARPLQIPDFMAYGSDNVKSHYPSQKILGKLFRRLLSFAELEALGTNFCSKVNPEPRLLVNGFEKYVDIARPIYLQYCDELSRLMRFGSINNESPLFTTSEGPISNSLTQIILYFRRLFETVSRDSAADPASMAAAWYYAAYSGPILPLGVNSFILSFPWIVGDHLSTNGAVEAQAEMCDSLDLQARDQYHSTNSTAHLPLAICKVLNFTSALSKLEASLLEIDPQLRVTVDLGSALLNLAENSVLIFVNSFDINILSTKLPLLLPEWTLENYNHQLCIKVPNQSCIIISLETSERMLVPKNPVEFAVLATLTRGLKSPGQISPVPVPNAVFNPVPLAELIDALDLWRSQCHACDFNGFGKLLLSSLSLLVNSQQCGDLPLTMYHRLALTGDLNELDLVNVNRRTAVLIARPVLLPKLLKRRFNYGPSSRSKEMFSSPLAAGAKTLLIEGAANEAAMVRFNVFLRRRRLSHLSEPQLYSIVLKDKVVDSKLAFTEYWSRSRHQLQLMMQFSNYRKRPSIRYSLKFGDIYLSGGLPKMWLEEFGAQSGFGFAGKPTISLLRTALERQASSQYRSFLMNNHNELDNHDESVMDCQESALEDGCGFEKAIRDLDALIENGNITSSSQPEKKKRKPSHAAKIKCNFEPQIIPQSASNLKALLSSNSFTLIEQGTNYFTGFRGQYFVYDENLVGIGGSKDFVRWLVADCVAASDDHDCRFTVTTSADTSEFADLIEFDDVHGLKAKGCNVYSRRVQFSKYKISSSSTLLTSLPDNVRQSLVFNLSHVIEYDLPGADGIFTLIDREGKWEFEVSITDKDSALDQESIMRSLWQLRKLG